MRHRIHQVAGTRATAMTVSGERSVIRPPIRPARSEIRNQCFSLRVSSQLDSPGMSKVPSESIGGDCLAEPCSVLAKVNFER